MKKILVLTIAILMIFMIAACGGGGGATPDEPATNPPTAPPPTEPEGDFFPGISDDDLPEIMKRKAGRVESATFVPSSDPDFTSEIFITLADCPMHFYSILSDHYNVGALSSELPLEEDQMRYYTFDWGVIELSNKELLINQGEIKVHAKIY